jgi:hypothetical protein
MVPGRRFALAVGVVLATSGGGVAAADSTSDIPMVSATIYPASGGSVVTQTVTLGTLEQHCQSSPTPPDEGLYGTNGVPTGQTYNASSYVYSMNCVLTSGLAQPIQDVDSVEIISPQYGFEEGNGVLTTGDLKDPPSPGSFSDPNAEPEVSTDPEGDVSYFRPWRGGSDDNVHDEISSNGQAVSIVVFEDGTPLNVTATSHINSGLNVSFSATVATANGTVIPPSSLHWTWDFGDGSAQSTQAAPVAYTYASTGDYPATVVVYDHSTGQVGTANDPVDFPTPTAPSTTPQTGSGTTTPNSGAPNGPTTTAGKNPKTPPGGKKPTVTSPSTRHHTKHPGTSTHTHKGKSTHHTKTTPASTPIPTGTGGSGASSTGSSKAANDKTLASKHSAGHTTTHAKSASHRANGTTLVKGRLISDVTTLPADQSPLVHAVSAPVGSAPVVRRATSGPSNLPVILAGILAVLLLFGFGVGRELRWRHDWPALPFGA